VRHPQWLVDLIMRLTDLVWPWQICVYRSEEEIGFKTVKNIGCPGVQFDGRTACGLAVYIHRMNPLRQLHVTNYKHT
jgi:hypothetical protein